MYIILILSIFTLGISIKNKDTEGISGGLVYFLLSAIFIFSDFIRNKGILFIVFILWIILYIKLMGYSVIKKLVNLKKFLNNIF